MHTDIVITGAGPSCTMAASMARKAGLLAARQLNGVSIDREKEYAGHIMHRTWKRSALI